MLISRHESYSSLMYRFSTGTYNNVSMDFCFVDLLKLMLNPIEQKMHYLVYEVMHYLFNINTIRYIINDIDYTTQRE
jgi:hypothetical protein